MKSCAYSQSNRVFNSRKRWRRTMVNTYKILGLIGIVAVAGLLITACTSSNATQSDRYALVKANPSSNPPVTEMANMNMSGSSTAKSKTSAPAAPDQVMIENFSFAPATITVKAGTKVTWVNHDDVPHTVDENDKRFRSGTLDTDDQYSFTFTSPGTFNYFCALHPKMTGQVIVK